MSEQLAVRKSRIYGRGCFALARFAARKKIATFTGEMIRGKRRIAARLRQPESRIVCIGDELAVDGAQGGNATAFINHSCEPNAFLRAVPGEKIVIFALRDIAPGEEVTMDYKDPNHPLVCLCGADKCRSNARRAET